MNCAVCGEEVTLDDLANMAEPEVKLFHRGEGCPSCFDEVDIEEDELENETDQDENFDTWACDECEVEIVTDDEGGLYWQGGKPKHSYGPLKYPWSKHPHAKNPIEDNLDAALCPGCDAPSDEDLASWRDADSDSEDDSDDEIPSW